MIGKSRQCFKGQARFDIRNIQDARPPSGSQRHGDSHVATREEQHVGVEITQDAARGLVSTGKLTQVTGQGAQTYTMQARRRNGLIGQPGPGDQISFHTGFTANPQHRVNFPL